MNMSEETKNSLREFQEYQQQLRMILTQKTQLEMRLAETKKALEEISQHNPSEVYKIVGQIMLKTDSEKAKKGLDDEAEMIDVRLKSLKKQESSINDKLKSIQEKLEGSFKPPEQGGAQ
ncbi:MAG: prefoldin subunit beta [Euryarchaeota archaeon]|nr:prefoldin subunit beta [Euryarchaeota archaeon]|tara:strand:- start:24826 stop:25182 length:357 start_codon:yes stop_codon:yes gene_type:complete